MKVRNSSWLKYQRRKGNVGHFALSTSIEEILERRKRHNAKLDETAGKNEAGTLSPDREYGFSNLNVREQGEKPCPGLRQSSK
jgi:hypothetical protein